MVNVSSEIIIDAPVDKVVEYTSNPDNAPEWYVNIKSAEWKTPKPMMVGSLIIFKARFLGRDLNYTYEITEFIPNQKLIMQTAEGPFPMQTTYLWEAIDENHTKMILKNAGNPSGFYKLFAPVIAKMMKKENEKDLMLLKKIIEEIY